MTAVKPRGIRNNNPGNIEFNPANNWLGQTGTDGRYATFSEMKYGVRAAGKLLRNYQTRYGINNVRDLITRWAPDDENPTAAYIKNVAATAGVAPIKTIDIVNDDVMLFRVLKGIFRQENGGDFVDDMTIKEGIALI